METSGSSFENSFQILSKHLSMVVACSSQVVSRRSRPCLITLLPNQHSVSVFPWCHVFCQGRSDTSIKNFEDSFQDGFIRYVNVVACSWEHQRRCAGRCLNTSLSPKFHVWHFLMETRQSGVDCVLRAPWGYTGDDSGPNGHNLVSDYWKIHQEQCLYCLETKNMQFRPYRFWALPSLLLLHHESLQMNRRAKFEKCKFP